MRLTVAIPATVLMMCAAVIGFGLLAAPASRAVGDDDAPRTGMERLRAFQCRRAETKRILIRGVEDGFSASGEEPDFIRPGRRSAFTESFYRGGSYDQDQVDRRFTDSFEVPAHVAGGLFVISLRKLGDNDNDTFGIGDITSVSAAAWGGRQLATGVRLLPRTSGWTVAGPLHFANLADIRFGPPQQVHPPGSAAVSAAPRSFATLLDYVRAATSTAWVDVVVQDDTSVDFMGMALCLEPPRRNGLTLKASDGPSGGAAGTVFLACRQVGDDNAICDPYRGDTPCEAERPVACIRPGDAPAPAGLKSTPGYPSWSGGRLAITEPVAGNRFGSVKDVDRFCAARFGAGWRVAAFHDGFREGIAGLGERKAMSSRVWVDIADQPYATCWTRR